MEKVAFISGASVIYWSSIVQAIAIAAGACAYVGLYVKKSKNSIAAALSVPLAIVLSALLGRLIHWYGRADSYTGFAAAMTDYSWGSFALMGAFFGCFLTAILLRLLRVSKNLPQMLDCAVIGLGVAIAVGRLSFFFNASDRGMIVPESWGIPFAYPVTNPVSGLVENRLATFLLQGLVTAAITLGLLLYSGMMQGKKRKLGQGDICLLFLSYYCCSQVLFDSTRYDSLFMRSNGFVSIVQILSAVTLVAVMVLFTVAMLSNGMKKRVIVLWVLFLAFTGGAGFMEYYVQRHGDSAGFAYTVMGICLCVMALIITLARHFGFRSASKKKKGKFLR